MKISLIGYGKMGQQLERLAKLEGVEIANIFSAEQPVIPSKLRGTVSIDFTTPTAFEQQYELLIRESEALVVGTTGWESVEKAVGLVAERWHKRVVYASNFALGMHFFYQALRAIAPKLAQYGYQAYIVEKHHCTKKDRPSGTAKRLQELLAAEHLVTEPQAVRCGELCGEHEVGFVSGEDQLIFSHQAFNRTGLAKGALLAARQILQYEGWGLLSLGDLLAACA